MSKASLKREEAQKEELSKAYGDFNKGLYSYAFFKVSNHEIGEDMVQETFVKTWKYLVSKGKIDGMKSFLYHILNNLIVDEYRKRKRKPTSLDTLTDGGFTPSIDNSEELFNTIDGKVAVLLIKKLPDIYREIVHMRYVQDLSLKEMAEITGQSENTLSVRVHRGVHKLRVLYMER